MAHPNPCSARSRLTWIVAAAFVWAVAPVALQSASHAQDRSLPAFRSDAELRALFRSLADESSGGSYSLAPPPAVSAPLAPGDDSAAADIQEIVVTGTLIDNPSVTNTQEVGVDEGGIVKVAGDHLIILRRGRLFSVSTAGGTLRPVDAIDAFPPGVDASDDWYDEMLIRGDQIIVVGYSYGRGGSEVNRFRIGTDGALSYVDSHHLKSNDYYSSRNYASRLIGDELILYTPLDLYFDGDKDDDPLDALPGVSRWQPGQAEPVFRRLVRARDVYVPRRIRSRDRRASIDTLHTVTRCDLSRPQLDCRATVVMGPSGRSFYVASDAVYVWLNAAWRWEEGEQDPDAYLYRIPLDRDARPQAIRVQGSPVDQFSFRADPRRRRLDVLVVSDGGGDAMWRPEFASGTPALLGLDLSRFGDGEAAASRSAYRILPSLGPDAGLDHNRFVGSHLLYAQRQWTWESTMRAQLVAIPLDGDPPVVLPVPGSVSRIEPLGRDALVVAGDETSAFLTIDLSSGQAPTVMDRYASAGSREAESRSHAFFFRPDAGSPDGADGLLGLPVIGQAEPAQSSPLDDQAQMIFLRRADRRLGAFGRLLPTADIDQDDDGCQASCVDWYGDARPIFLGDRVFALLGYELVEGDPTGPRIRERQRITFSPPAQASIAPPEL